jgi:hypothetical protein
MFFIRSKPLYCKACILLATVLLTGSTYAGKVYYVDSDFQGENSVGTSWLSAFPTIQEAINTAAANQGDEIWVKAGVYTPSGKDRMASFLLKSGIHLYGRSEEPRLNSSHLQESRLES